MHYGLSTKNDFWEKTAENGKTAILPKIVIYRFSVRHYSAYIVFFEKNRILANKVKMCL